VEGKMITKLRKFADDVARGDYAQRGHQYSQVIKAERIKHNMTLEEMAKGICSVSYLCKVENQDIVPAEDYVHSLFERVNIDYKNLVDSEADVELNTIIEAYFLCDFEKVKDYYLSVNWKVNNANVYLSRSFYFLVNKEYDKFKQEIALLDEIKKSLTEEQAILLLFLVCSYYVITHQFHEAYKYTCCLEIINITNPKIRAMSYEQRVFVAYQMRRYPQMLRAFEVLKKEYFISYPSKRQILIELTYQLFRGKDYPELSAKAAKRISFESLSNLCDIDIIYFKYLVLLAAKEYKMVYEEIKEYSLSDQARFLALIGYCAYQLRNDEYQNQFLQLIPQVTYNTDDTIHHKFIKFLEIKFTATKTYDLLEYLKYDVIPYSYNYLHKFYNQIYQEEYIDILCKLSRYKEAVYYMINKMA
jgi:transcriptional regulator with XRE-family HTH domain